MIESNLQQMGFSVYLRVRVKKSEPKAITHKIVSMGFYVCNGYYLKSISHLQFDRYPKYMVLRSDYRPKALWI